MNINSFLLFVVEFKFIFFVKWEIVHSCVSSFEIINCCREINCLNISFVNISAVKVIVRVIFSIVHCIGEKWNHTVILCRNYV